MCDNCAERAQKLRSVALSSRATSELAPPLLATRLGQTADELDAIAHSLSRLGHCLAAGDIVWDDRPAREVVLPQATPCS